jgi:hypothetical protein
MRHRIGSWPSEAFAAIRGGRPGIAASLCLFDELFCRLKRSDDERYREISKDEKR